MRFSNQIFISSVSCASCMHTFYPKVDLAEAMALFQRIKNCLVYPEKQISIDDLHISIADAEAIVNDVMLVFETQQQWKTFWTLNLKGTEFNTAVRPFHIEFMTRKQWLDMEAKERGIVFDNVPLPDYLFSKREQAPPKDENYF